jgi:hypothetical protein
MIPVYRSGADVLERFRAVLALHLPAVLAAGYAARGYGMPQPKQIALTPEVPVDFDTPGLFMTERSSEPVQAHATGTIDVLRRVAIGVVVSEGVMLYAPSYTGPRDERSVWVQALRDYAAAVRWVLTCYAPEIGADTGSGLWSVELGNDAPEDFAERDERDAWLGVWTIEMVAIQRVRHWQPLSPVALPLLTDLGEPILTDLNEPILV